MPSIGTRLTALEQRPQNRIPHFSVKFVDGGIVTAFGYGLLALDDVQYVHYDHKQPCAMVVLDLFQALHPSVEVVADA